MDEVGDTANAQHQDQASLISKGKASGIAVASVIAGLSSLLITMVSARFLSVEDNKEFLVFWSFLFGIFGIVSGTQAEMTRAATAGQSLPEHQRGARLITVAMRIGLVLSVVLAASSPLWAPKLTPSSPVLTAVLVSIGCLAYAGAMFMQGTLAGLKEWSHFSFLVGGEGFVRLALVVVAALAGFTLVGFEVASWLPAFFWLILLLTAPGRRAATARADVDARQLTRNTIQTMASAGAIALLTTGFATILQASSPGEDAAVLATTMLVVTMTRTPIMLPLQAFQGVMINWVTQSKTSYRKPLLKIFTLLGLLAVVAAVAAGLLGPWLMRVLFGPAYDSPWWLLACLMVAGVLVASLVITGAIAVGLGEHQRYLAGWVAAAIVTCVMLFVVPYTAPVRAIMALIVGPAIGLVLHLTAIVRNEPAA